MPAFDSCLEMAKGRRGSVALGLGFVLLMLPMLAATPQSGDGAELVRVALQGGVLHPPGFPVQAWLDRFFIWLPFRNPATCLALLSLLGHGLAVYLISETVRLLGGGFTGRFAAAAGFALFPSAWYRAVQPEVFSLAHVCIAALLLQAVTLAGEESWKLRYRAAAGLGLLVGLSASQHPITVTAAPAFITSAVLILRHPRQRLDRLVTMAGVFLAVVLLFYGSLPLLRTSSPWPDWGKLASAEDVFNHALRRAYGTMTLSADVDAKVETITGTEVFLPALWKCWSVLLFLVPQGFIALWRLGRGKREPYLATLGGTALLGLVLLARARVNLRPWNSDAVLERFDGPSLIPIAVLLGLGVDWFRALPLRPAFRRLIDAGVAGFAIWMAVTGWARSDASQDFAIEVYHRALGQAIPPEAIFLSNADQEALYGIPTDHGVRYPIEKGLLPAPWYTLQVVPQLDPRITPNAPRGNLADIVEVGYNAGMMVVSTRPELLAGKDRVAQLRGLYFVVQKSLHTAVSPETVEYAVRLCPFLSELRPLPEVGHGFSRWPIAVFARAYEGARLFLEASGNREGAALAKDITEAISSTREPARWNRACSQLSALWKGGHG